MYSPIPEIFLLVVTLFLLLFAVTRKIKRSIATVNTTVESLQKQQINTPLLMESLGYISVVTLTLTAFLLSFRYSITNKINPTLCKGFVIDDMGTVFQLFILFTSIALILMIIEYCRKEKINSFEYLIVILISVFSMMAMVCASDLISMYLTIELQSLCFYILAASKRDSDFSSEAGLKYIIIGALASGVLLIGCSIIYGHSGCTNFDDIKYIASSIESESQLIAVRVGVLCITIAYLVKLAAAPFHQWAPDVYEGAPLCITAYFSTVPKIALFGLGIRLFSIALASFANVWVFLFLVASISSMLIGALGAIMQTKIKRMLAYSSIGHIGFLLLPFATKETSYCFIYLFVYICMSLNIFAVLISLQSRRERMKNISDLAGLGKTNPILAFVLTLTFFSMSGIPPLAGCFPKFLVLYNAISSYVYIPGIIGIVSSMISCFYYLRVIRTIYFGHNPSITAESMKGTTSRSSSLNYNISIIVIVCSSFLLFFLFYPDPLLRVAASSILKP